MYIAVRLHAYFAKTQTVFLGDLGRFRHPGFLSPFCQQECVNFPSINYLSPTGFQFWQIISKGGLPSPGQGVVQTCPNIHFLPIIWIMSMGIQGLNLGQSSLPFSRYLGTPWFLSFWGLRLQLSGMARIGFCCLPPKNPDGANAGNPPPCLHPSLSPTLNNATCAWSEKQTHFYATGCRIQKGPWQLFHESPPDNTWTQEEPSPRPHSQSVAELKLGKVSGAPVLSSFHVPKSVMPSLPLGVLIQILISWHFKGIYH